MAFGPAEKERIRYHLGYLNVQPAASLQFGQVSPIQTLFMVDSAMEKVLPEGENRIRKMLSHMDRIECEMMEGIDFLPANRTEGVEIRREHIDDLEKEYYRWATRLAGQLGVPLYYYAEKFRLGRSGSITNVRVKN